MSFRQGGTKSGREVGVAALKYLAILGLTGMIGYVDYLTGYQRSVIALYSLPLALAVRTFGFGVGLAHAVLTTLFWGWIDIVSGDPYTTADIFGLSAANCLFFFVAVVFLTHYSMQNNELNKRLLRAFAGELAICRQCEKIQSPDDHWSHFTAYLAENSTAIVKHKICPDCARMVYAAFRT